MKHKFLPTLSPRLKALVVLLILAFVVNSCKKDKSTAQQENITDPLIVQAKGWYEGTYPQSLNVGNNLKNLSTNSTSNGATDYSQLIKPDWKHASSYDRFNKKVVEIPIDPSAKFSSSLKNMSTNKTIYKKEYSRSSFLLLNDGKNYEAYVMTILADSAYLKNDLSKLARNTYSKRDADFSGMVLYFTPKGAFVSGALYKDGHIVPPQSSSANASNTKAQSIGNPNVKPMSDEKVCWDYWEVSYTNGIEDSRRYLYTSCEVADPDGGGVSGNSGSGGGGGGGGSTGAPTSPPPPPCAIAGSSITGQLVAQNVPTGPGDGGGFPPPTPPCTAKSAPYTPTTTQFTQKIDDSKLADCFRNILNNLKNIDYNCVGNTISKFSGETPGFNWKVQDGYANGNNGQTSPIYDSQTGTVTTTFNSSNFTSGSDLAIAKTILHESVHAYLLAYFHVDYQNANSTYSKYVDDFFNATHNDLNAAQHNEMVRSFIGQIATTLEQYGQLQGYNLDYQFYSDLAWGGLTETQAFIALDQGVQDRILNVIYSEQNGKDRSGNPVNIKGTASGCK